MTLTFDARVHCGARSKRSGKPCCQVKGARTDHKGSGRCFLHGGRTPNGRRFAQVEAAENVLRTLEIEASIDPIASLFEAVRVAAWREAGLRRLLMARETLAGPDHLGDGRPDVVATMHADALDQRAKIAKMAVDAGLDDRLVRLAERQADVVLRAIAASMDAAGVTDPAMRNAGELAAAEILEVALPTGGERN